MKVVDAKPNSPLTERRRDQDRSTTVLRMHVQRTRVSELAVVLGLTVTVPGGRGVGGSELGLSFLEVGHGFERAVGGERRVEVGER